jgi:predicted transcriptional regulator
MRITIEIDPSELGSSVKVEGAKDQALVEKDTDAGGPPEFLVEALSDKKEPEPESTQILDQNAGAGPAWPIEAPEDFFFFEGPGGNDAG